MERSLTRARRKTVRDPDGRLIERFAGEHYCFGSSPPSRHTDHLRFELFGRTVAIHRDDVEALRGKQFVIVQSDRIDAIQYTHDILVAQPGLHAPNET